MENSMAQIHLVGGEKGGVGKSLVSRLLAQYLIDHEQAFIGFDTDRSHGALMRFYPGYASPILVDRSEAFDTVMEAAAAEPERRVLVDLAAQTHESLARWMEEGGVFNLAEELGLKLCYWHVCDCGKDSVDLLHRLLNRFGSGLHYVIVRNQVRGNDFSLLEHSGEQTRAQSLGARVMTLKKLSESVVNKIDVASSTFWRAKGGAGNLSDEQQPDPGLGLMGRQRLKMWLRDVYRELDELKI
jgi:hypothetical protein